MTVTVSPATLDMRTMAPQDRHSHVIAAFNQLSYGEGIELVNDHDPKPLHTAFQSELAGKFSWDYLEQGPATWRVAITKLAPAKKSGCCGGCGGGGGHCA
ncbi:MAG: DUF2249 domain-containing protein [Polaromonas sp.]